MSKTGSETPGALRSHITLQINTRKAQGLIKGRRQDGARPAIIGLLRFAAIIGPIYAAAAKDDPWADWWLVKIERELDHAKDELVHLRAKVEEVMNQRKFLEVQTAYCEEPLPIQLRFRNPYAFRGAYLIADYDELVLLILTARHVGFMSRKESEAMFERGGRLVRRVFHSADGYRFLAVSREDVRQGTARAARARDALGELPHEVLDGTLRGAYAPTAETLQVEAHSVPGIGDKEDWSSWDDDGDSEGSAAAS